MNHAVRGPGFILLFVMTFIIYSNSFDGSWQFDDYPNIIGNTSIHITDLSFKSLFNTFFSKGLKLEGKTKRLYRPVASLSLALNWYWGRDNVFGYHLVNITIHFIASYFLFLTIMLLLKTPNIRGKYEGSEYFIALFATTLWCVHPINTQAITYIVQRMASLAAMFYIIGIYFYLRLRMSQSRQKLYLWAFFCFLSFILALGSKENTITFPGALMLVEICFFQNLNKKDNVRKMIKAILITGVIILFIGSVIFILRAKSPVSFLMDWYEQRNYTPIERLMTEARIVVFYLSQLFYPIVDRLSIVHDFPISTSLFNPVTTIPSILFIFLSILFGIFQIKKRAVLSFAILFFFLNHMIESTILPLELLFEHRNYLPSMFLFLPLAIGLKLVLDYYSDKKRSMYVLLSAFASLLIMAFGMGTYIRNFTWQSSKTLWEDVMEKAPELARPYIFLGGYYNDIGDNIKALALYKKALNMKDPTPKKSNAAALNNIGIIYSDLKDYKKAISYFKKALELEPGSSEVLHNLALNYIKTGEPDKALMLTDRLIQSGNTGTRILNLKGLIFIKKGKFKQAAKILKNSFKMEPGNTMAILNLGIALSKMKRYVGAEVFFNQAILLAKNEILPFFWQIENSISAGNNTKTDYYINRLLNAFSLKQIEVNLETLPKDGLLVVISHKLIGTAIIKHLKSRVEKFENRLQ